MAARPPRIISFEQLCIEADPNWVIDNYQPPDIYRFSNGRTFDHHLPFYAPNVPTQDEILATDTLVILGA